MSFTAEEIIEIEETAKVSPIVRRLWKEIQLVDQDAGAKFYKALTEAVIAITGEVDAAHTGKYSQFKILKGDPKMFKRIFQLLTKSKPIIDGLVKAKKLIEPKKSKKEKVVSPEILHVSEDIGDEEENSGVSFTDRLANQTKK